MNLEIIIGDITLVETDAMVNAANASLLGGGGVDGAIHDAAGPLLLKECHDIGGCHVGDAKVTRAYELPAKYVFHAVGPIWVGGDKKENILLANCYRNCLKLADKYKCEKITFPSISTGAYGYPLKKASRIAIKTIKEYFENNDSIIENVIMVCFNDKTYEAYMKAYRLIYNKV